MSVGNHRSVACEQALSGVGGGGGGGGEGGERACNDVSGICMPSKKKGLEGSILSDALRKTGILAEKNSTLSDRVCHKNPVPHPQESLLAGYHQGGVTGLII